MAGRKRVVELGQTDKEYHIEKRLNGGELGDYSIEILIEDIQVTLNN